MVTNKFEWLLISLNGYEWLLISSNGYEWLLISLNEFEWLCLHVVCLAGPCAYMNGYVWYEWWLCLGYV